MDLSFEPKHPVAAEFMPLISGPRSTVRDWDFSDPEVDLKVQNGEWISEKFFLVYDPTSLLQQRLDPRRLNAKARERGLWV